MLYGSRTRGGERIDKKLEGVYNQFKRLCLMKSAEEQTDYTLKKISQYMKEETCPDCGGKRLDPQMLSCRINGYNISEMCEMEFRDLREELLKITDPRGVTIVEQLVASLDRMIDIGLPYLSMIRESSTLSGGEAQRLKLVRYMGSSLTDMIYIFDEPSTGMHPRDVHRMSRLLKSLRDKGNTVLVVEHDKDIIRIADEVIDVGPLGVLTVVTGVAGSGKSSLIRDVFAKQYADRVVLVDQSAVTATGRSTACTYLGFFDEIRKVFAAETGADAGLFSFNSKGACPACKGRGMITTELVFMDPVTTVCESCGGSRYSEEALSHLYKGKNIVDVLNMSVEDALDFFAENNKIRRHLEALVETGLHASDIRQIMELLDSLIRRGNTVIVIEHNTDVMKLADYIIDIGPDGGTSGGEVVFTGTPQEMMEHADTITARYLRK